ncbi:MAG: hypothetical protein LBL45_07220 [Treponema sp.]|jgi:hypothetical protein|nr:hypothetical protein [Treponema sp.]
MSGYRSVSSKLVAVAVDSSYQLSKTFPLLLGFEGMFEDPIELPFIAVRV